MQQLASKARKPRDLSAIPADRDSPATSTATPGHNYVVPASVRMLASILAWLSGAGAGIGAIFYVCGVLVTIANLDMLGLDPLAFRYDPTFYMHRGGTFLLVFAADMGQFFFWTLH